MSVFPFQLVNPFIRVSRRARVLAGLAVALACSLTGCSNSPYPTGQTAKPVLYRSLADDPKTFDPSIAYDVAAAEVIDPIYPSYLQYNYLKRDPFVLELSLGAAMPENKPFTFTTTEKDKAGAARQVTKTGQVWTFRIKPNLRFQDDPCFAGGKGRAITATDFLYSFRRMADPAVACPIVSFFDDKILGMQDYEEHQKTLEKNKQNPDYNFPMKGLELDANDPYTFHIKMSQPYPQLRFLMAMHFTSPLAHEAVDMYGKQLARHPVGCGAYMMTSYKPKGGIVLKANPNYRKDDFYPTEGSPGDAEAGMLKDAGKQLPFVHEIQYNIVREGVTGWNMFLQGYMDMSGVGQSNFQQVLTHNSELSPEMKTRGIGLHRDVAVDVSYFCFNMNDAVVGNVDASGKPLPEAEALKHRKLRQAISCSIDSQKFIDIIDLGLGKNAQWIVAPGLFGYDPNFKNPYRQVNIEKAKALLAEAGYPNGVDAKTGERLTIYWDNYLETTAAGRQQLQLYQQMIEATGIHIESRGWPFATFQGKVDKGEYQFINFGWVADYPDPENFVFLLYGPNKRPGPNACNYVNPEYDKLFDQMRVLEDGPQRQAIINKMRDITVEDCPWIYTVHNESFALTQPWLTNYKPHPVSMDTVKYWNVDGNLRARLQAEWNTPNYWPLIGIAALIIAGSLPAIQVVRQRTNRHVRRNTGGK